jgi:hypothetical protein
VGHKAFGVAVFGTMFPLVFGMLLVGALFPHPDGSLGTSPTVHCTLYTVHCTLYTVRPSLV